jgi:hypothetical protein
LREARNAISRFGDRYADFIEVSKNFFDLEG